MADPTARFVLHGDDRSGPAFDSLGHSLHDISRNISQTTRFFHEFGVALGINELRKWVAGALDMKKASAEQGAAIKEAKQSLSELNDEFENITRTIALKFIPQVTQAAKFWNETMFPAEDQSKLQKITDELTVQQETVRQLQGQLKAGPSFWAGLFGGDSPEQLKTRLETAQRLATDTFNKVIDARNKLTKKGEPGVLDEFHDVVIGTLRPFPKFDQSQTKEQWQKQLDDMLPEMDAGIIPHMMPFPKGDLDPIRKDFKDLQQAVGRGLHDSIVEGLVGGEFAFKDFLKRTAAELFTSALFKGLAGMFTGGSTWGSFFSGLFGGSRAGGGPTTGGLVYRVHPGEAFFTSGDSGSVGKAGGGGLVYAPVTTIDARGAGPGTEAALRAVIEANNKRQKAEIADLMRRGRFAK